MVHSCFVDFFSSIMSELFDYDEWFYLSTLKSFTNFSIGVLHVPRQFQRITAVSMLRFKSYIVKDRYIMFALLCHFV